MTSVRVNTCIVGGGPAGLLLGLLLAKRGADVLVLEGHETFDREFRGEVLQPSTALLLDELGLLDYMLAQPHSLLEAAKIRLNGREVGELSFKKIAPAHPHAIWMPQPIFLNALLRKAEPFPPFTCWMGAKVSGLIQEDGCTVGVRGLRHGKEPFEVRADVVVGADGRYSSVAKLGGFTAEYEHHDFDLIWFTIEQPPGWSSTFYVSLGQEVRGLMLPKYPHHIQAGIALPTGEWRRWRNEGVAAVANRVRAAGSDLFRVRGWVERLHAVFPAARGGSPGPGLGAGRLAPDRRRRSHDEPGRGDRRQRGSRHRRGDRPGALPAPRPRSNPAQRSASRSAAARGGRTHHSPPAVAGAARAGGQHSSVPVGGVATASARAAIAARAAPPTTDLCRRPIGAARAGLQLPRTRTTRVGGACPERRMLIGSAVQKHRAFAEPF
jgi:hypothetical protein